MESRPDQIIVAIASFTHFGIEGKFLFSITVSTLVLHFLIVDRGLSLLALHQIKSLRTLLRLGCAWCIYIDLKRRGKTFLHWTVSRLLL